MATHYCPQSNQPRLVLTTTAPTQPRFNFHDATDLDRATESVAHDLVFDLTDPRRVVRSEVYRWANGDEADRMALVRR